MYQNFNAIPTLKWIVQFWSYTYNECFPLTLYAYILWKVHTNQLRMKLNKAFPRKLSCLQHISAIRTTNSIKTRPCLQFVSLLDEKKKVRDPFKQIACVFTVLQVVELVEIGKARREINFSPSKHAQLTKTPIFWLLSFRNDNKVQ